MGVVLSAVRGSLVPVGYCELGNHTRGNCVQDCRYYDSGTLSSAQVIPGRRVICPQDVIQSACSALGLHEDVASRALVRAYTSCSLAESILTAATVSHLQRVLGVFYG